MLGNRIQRLRQERKLTLSQLAAKTGISKSYLSHIERSIQTNPSIEVLTKLALTLEVDIQTLITPDPGSDSENSASEKDWSQIINEALQSGKIDEKKLQEMLTAIQNQKGMENT